MKTIDEMAEMYVEERRDLDVGHANAQFNCFNMIDAVKFGANYAIEEIENFMKGLDLGNSAEEKFYKLDVLADISSFIEQLKEK